ncbi:YaiI/YqxD family protein [Salinarimonas chemoclinalis]|uniref:YaiI/YqxD family protein n=1 Tax=Salinarimonas chemoclinalis TaxID=3241599 RepID=UPI003558FC68
MTILYIDADACPVKDEAYAVAARFGVAVKVVSNAFLRVPPDAAIERVIVPGGLDVADDWIAERVAPGDVVVTADVPLADRCVKAGAVALAPTGKVFDAQSIGMARAVRDLMSDLREAGAVTGGPKPFSPRDRSAFRAALDRELRRATR